MSDVLENELMSDEMPVAPAQADEVPFGNDERPEIDIDGSMDMDDVVQAQDFGENLPKGVYHLRLDAYKQRSFPNNDLDGHGDEPHYDLEWTVVGPPKFAGRKFFERLKAVREHDSKLARMGDPDAIKKRNGRLGKTKSLLAALRFTKKSFDLKRDVLNTKPEVYAEIIQKPKPVKLDDGTWGKDKDDLRNEVKKYLPIGKA